MKCLPCVHACVHLSYFLINLYIAFIYEDIFSKFAENVYGCENMAVTNFVLILKNKAVIADWLKIIDMF